MTIMKLVVANADFATVKHLDGSLLFMVNTDERRAMAIIAHEYNFDEKKLEALMREYSVIKSHDLENYDTATETYNPSPREIADNFVSWLSVNKKIFLQRSVGSLNRL